MNVKNNIPYDLDDKSRFIKVLSFEIGESFTYGDTRKGHCDRSKRERIREIACQKLEKHGVELKWWAFRIEVGKPGKAHIDIDNVPKIIIDSFSKRQIKRDKSKYENMGLYEDDSLPYVKLLHVMGSESKKAFMKIEVFGSIPG